MKKQMQTLHLNRETLANLSRPGLKDAAAGFITGADPCTAQCNTFQTCPYITCRVACG